MELYRGRRHSKAVGGERLVQNGTFDGLGRRLGRPSYTVAADKRSPRTIWNY
jgi:hypothetical protein